MPRSGIKEHIDDSPSSAANIGHPKSGHFIDREQRAEYIGKQACRAVVTRVVGKSQPLFAEIVDRLPACLASHQLTIMAVPAGITTQIDKCLPPSKPYLMRYMVLNFPRHYVPRRSEHPGDCLIKQYHVSTGPTLIRHPETQESARPTASLPIRAVAGRAESRPCVEVV